ncbi:MAG: hypothetical protein AAFQ61_13810 [Cyanobacteria bacterium J06626_23]
MTLLIGAAGASGISMTYFNLVYIVGFIAAVVIGSIAWYNSKRPAGWENAERPDFVPDMDTQSSEEEDTAE